MFLILCLPRSRSAWLAHYLSYPLARPLQPVGHDILAECDTIEKFLNSYKFGMWGTVETAGAPLWRIIRQEIPDCQIVLVRRPLIECHRSAIRAGFVPDLTFMAKMDAMLDAASTDPKIVSIPYGMLSDVYVGKMLFEKLLDLEFDFEWWHQLVNTNVQVDISRFADRLEHAGTNLKKLREEINEWPIRTQSLN